MIVWLSTFDSCSVGRNHLVHSSEERIPGLETSNAKYTGGPFVLEVLRDAHEDKYLTDIRINRGA